MQVTGPSKKRGERSNALTCLEELMSEAFGSGSVEGLRVAIERHGADAEVLRGVFGEKDGCDDSESQSAVAPSVRHRIEGTDRSEPLDGDVEALEGMSLDELRSLESALDGRLSAPLTSSGTLESASAIDDYETGFKSPAAPVGMRVAPPNVANSRAGDVRYKKGLVGSSAAACSIQPKLRSSSSVKWTCDLCGTVNCLSDPIRGLIRRDKKPSILEASGGPERASKEVVGDLVCSGCRFRPKTV